MKCENCGKNEVAFVYESNINGQVTEKHLCAECAEKLGYTQRFLAHQQQMMQGMQNFFSGGFGSLLDGFFSPASPALPGSGWFGEDLFDDFFSDMPALGAASAESGEAQEEQPEEPRNAQEQPAQGAAHREIPISGEEQSRFTRLRQRNALRLELKKAVHEENFERAAELRDQLRALEQENRENK